KIKDYKRKPIKIYISSNGGFVYDMWALIDIILTSKTPVYTYCTGYAMSAGLQIFLAGHKRYCSKHATFVYHQLSGGVVGTYQSMAENMDESKYQQNAIEEYVRSRTNITMKQLEEIRIKKHDVFIHSDEALDLGIVDEIIE
ncbi:MAG: ClpP family protease, partial [Hominilimicola sp.]